MIDLQAIVVFCSRYAVESENKASQHVSLICSAFEMRTHIITISGDNGWEVEGRSYLEKIEPL